MPAPWIVAKVCLAEQHLRDAEKLLGDACVDVVAARDGDPGAAAVVAEMHAVDDALRELRDRLAVAVAGVSALTRSDDERRDRRRYG